MVASTFTKSTITLIASYSSTRPKWQQNKTRLVGCACVFVHTHNNELFLTVLWWTDNSSASWSQDCWQLLSSAAHPGCGWSSAGDGMWYWTIPLASLIKYVICSSILAKKLWLYVLIGADLKCGKSRWSQESEAIFRWNLCSFEPGEQR